MIHAPHRGFTLLIALVLTSVVLAVGLALTDITYKQVILASTAKQSQYAFYAADAAMECVLYSDQQKNAFDYNSTGGTISCQGQSIAVSRDAQTSATSTFSFSIPCVSGGTVYPAVGKIYKGIDGRSLFYTRGYNTCNQSDPRRIERGLRVSY